MSQKEIFEKTLQKQFNHYSQDKRAGLKTSSLNFCFKELEGFDFDIDTTFIECAKNADINYLILDVATLNHDDIEKIIANWDQPTTYLFKNYGDESAGNIRTKISIFIKDRYLGIQTSSDTEPQVAFCGVTVTKDKPIRDFYERQVFFTTIDF